MIKTLPKTLSYLEIVGLGLGGHIGWVATAPYLYEALGSSSIFVWTAISFISIIFLFQVKGLATHYKDVSGGTAIYIGKLFNSKLLRRYLAYGYYMAWAGAPALYSIILVNLIKNHLPGVDLPIIPLRVLFVSLAYIVGLSGTRALAILHSILCIPAALLLIDYFVEGIIPALGVPIVFEPLSLIDFCKWYFVATYSVYYCETVAAFIPEAFNEKKGINFLNYSALLLPIVFVGCSFVMNQLSTASGTDLYNNLYTSSLFWGGNRAIFSTLLLTSCSLVSCATATTICSRILYQLSVDKLASPNYSYISELGSIPYPVIVSMLISIVTVFYNNFADIIVITSASSVVSVYSLQLGVWLNRIPNTFRNLAPPIFIFQLIIFIGGSIGWGVEKIILGLCFPFFMELINLVVDKFKFRYKLDSLYNTPDPLPIQITSLMAISVITILSTWYTRGLLTDLTAESKQVILVVFLIVFIFIAIAFACWTSFNQIKYLNNAKQYTEAEVVLRTAELKDALRIVEENNILKDNFIATVSHELRTPLTNMKMAIQMVKISLSSVKDINKLTSLNTYLNILTKECAREVNLVNDLLDIQKLEVGSKQLHLEYINVKHLISDIAEVFNQRILDAKQILIVNLPELNIILESNSIDLTRVLNELIHNAYKYTPASCRIVVTVVQEGEQISISVLNTGVTISEEDSLKMFDRFYRIPEIDKHKRGGTGLGLFLIKHLVTHLRGTIKLNVLNNSVEFVVTLPLRINKLG